MGATKNKLCSIIDLVINKQKNLMEQENAEPDYQIELLQQENTRNRPQER